MNVLTLCKGGDRSFAVQVRHRRALAVIEELAFERRLSDWLEAHELRAEGSQTTFAVVADRELSATDQADVLLALLDDPAVRSVRISSIVTDGDAHAEDLEGRLWIEADRFDDMVDAARALYEAGRLNGDGFIDAIGGYVHRPSARQGGSS